MPSPLLRDLSEKHGVVAVDETSIDAFLSLATGEAEHVILFFAGDPAQRGETHDVAIILPQLLEAFAGRLRAAIVATRAEAALKQRFHVGVFPSLVVTRARRDAWRPSEGLRLVRLYRAYRSDAEARRAGAGRRRRGRALKSSTPSARPRDETWILGRAGGLGRRFVRRSAWRRRERRAAGERRRFLSRHQQRRAVDRALPARGGAAATTRAGPARPGRGGAGTPVRHNRLRARTI